MICVLHVHVIPLMYCNNWLVKFIFMNPSKEKSYKPFNFIFFDYESFKIMGE
jgi:hypothetical protein